MTWKPEEKEAFVQICRADGVPFDTENDCVVFDLPEHLRSALKDLVVIGDKPFP